MSFGGGGSGALPNHEHTNIALDGGPLDFVNTTIASLSANSMTYSSGAALQELTIGSDAQVLAVQGGSPSWITNTSNPLVKVSKTFADIVGAEIDIYTLPEDSALVNVWADITTTFDVSNALTIGDAADPDGFAQATDWTAGTGLTDATRGAYVTSFKTMRSTSGSTAIKAYGFSLGGGGTWTATGTGSGNFGQGFFGGQAHTSGIIIDAGNAVLGNIINYVDFHFNSDGQGSVSTDFVVKIFNAASVEQATVSLTATINDASTTVRFTFAGNTYTSVAGDYIQIDNNGGNYIEVEAFTATTDNYTGYRTPDPTANFPHVEVNYGDPSVDTQGAVDFYLQVVD